MHPQCAPAVHIAQNVKPFSDFVYIVPSELLLIEGSKPRWRPKDGAILFISGDDLYVASPIITREKVQKVLSIFRSETLIYPELFHGLLSSRLFLR